MERRLAAILAADVVGYSRLMESDEAGTIERLRSLRTELVEPAIAGRKGRIVKLMGDGLLAEFPSVVGAVECAADIQQRVSARETEEPDDRRIRLRIGINLGDIVIEDDDIYGDGVNIAARLEGLAEPGSICISGAAFDAIEGKTVVAFSDAGEQSLKNIAKRIRVYSLAAPGGAGSPVSQAPRRDTIIKPSVAILPFTNMSGDHEQGYFSDGITEDIITELARFGSVSVVARTSTFVYRDRAVNVSEAGKALGARYVLEGSIRKVASRIRLTAQLIDVETGKHVWAERYDRVLEDIFQIQDEIVHSIVATLVGRLETADTERSLRKPPESLAAYDYYLRALQHERQYDYEGHISEARALLEKAIALDPTFARAYALLSYFTASTHWFEPGSATDAYAKALELAQTAIRLDPNDSSCYGRIGIIYIDMREFDKAKQSIDQALKLNPHDAHHWTEYAWYLTAVGEHQKALDFLAQREKIEPFPPNYHWEIRGLAAYALGQYEEALRAFDRMTRCAPFVHGCRAACCGQLGRVEDAQRNWSKMLAVRPDWNIGRLRNSIVTTSAVEEEQWVAGLRKAGIAE